MADKALYYAVHVSTRATSARGTGWVWSRPFDAPAEARRAAKAAVDSGDASLAFAVVIGPGRREVMRTYPESARKIIDHYEDLWGRLEQPPPN